MNGIWLKTGPHFNIKPSFSPGTCTLHRTTHYKDRWLWYRLIFITGIPILIRLHLYTETASRALNTLLPNSLGQVKLPVGTVDLDKKFVQNFIWSTVFLNMQNFETHVDENFWVYPALRGSHSHIIQAFPPEKKNWYFLSHSIQEYWHVS